jgi:hypothetical protein
MKPYTDEQLAQARRTGKLPCQWCGQPRPLDCWCTCMPWDEQLALIEQRSTARTLNAGRWTPAGRRLEVRLS